MLALQMFRDFLEQYPCLALSEAPEIFGPTDVNAQSGNGSLSVGFNRDGTVTVLRYPSPSYYDHVKYRTTDREEPRFGADPNAGAFLGLALTTETGDTRTVWLREWESEQRYADPLSDAVVTEYVSHRHDVSVTVRDVVAPETDVLVRDVSLDVGPDADLRTARLVAVESCNVVVTKRARNPVQDWCRERENADAAHFDGDAEALVHAKAGVDESTGERQSVALGWAFADGCDAHQVGGDGFAANADHPPHAEDAFLDAADGYLRGNDAHEGLTTGGLATDLDLAGGAASATLLLAAGADAAAVLDRLDSARDRDPAAVRAAKAAWFDERVGDAPLPDTDEPAVSELACRALVTLLTNIDPETGAVVASIATQSPYALDWPRDGAYFNHALDMLGFHDLVAERNRWYADLQVSDGDPNPGQPYTPAGAWAMNYYADGVVGGPIPWEIDETALAVWTLWDHYAVTGDEAYLADVYPAIRRGADLLVEHRDPATGLHAPAWEDDNLLRSQTAVGAGAAWLGLDAAAKAARAMGEEADARRYRDRRAELDAAIEEHVWDEDAGAYSGGVETLVDRLEALPVVGDRLVELPLVPTPVPDATIAWPAEFRSADDPRMDRHLDRMWSTLMPSFAEPDRSQRQSGLYETKALIALGRAWRGDADLMDRVRRGVRWVATEHATHDTRVMGEVWLRDGDSVVTTVSQPHAWSQLLFYYASLEAFPPADADPPASGSVVEHLRERRGH